MDDHEKDTLWECSTPEKTDSVSLEVLDVPHITFEELSRESRTNNGKKQGKVKWRAVEYGNEDKFPPSPAEVSIRQRLKHFTWAWFTLVRSFPLTDRTYTEMLTWIYPMSTGGIALLLNATPHQFPGLTVIGEVVFLFDLVVFLCLCAAISHRFITNPRALKNSLMHPTESLFFPSFLLAISNVLGCIQVYGVPHCGYWLVVTERVLFWLYVAMALLVAVGQYCYLFTASPHRLTIQSMTPGWVLPIFPVTICGTLASTIAPTQPPTHRESIIVAGLTCQGLGWMVTLMVYAIFMHRLMQFGLPAPNLRPGMFIAVGPPSFTGLALIGLSQSLPTSSAYFEARPGMIMVLQTLADFTAMFLWFVSFWFFCIATVSVLSEARKMSFNLVWWSFIFPNVGFTLGTIKIGTQLQSEGILWVASAMTVLLVMMWIVVFSSHVRAVLRKKIMMPGLDEDKDEYKEDDRRHSIPVPP